jgi:hypothetical protein
MYTRYNLTLGSNSTSHVLSYDLESHRPAQVWAELMSTASVDSLRKNQNPWHGIETTPDSKITRLHELIDQLNVWIPEKITSQWNHADPQDSLNRLHIHFPELLRTEFDQDRLDQLKEYNTVIHVIEDILRGIKFGHTVWLLIIPEDGERINLIDEDYAYFKPNRVFGELSLAYPHLGRSVLDIVKARDYTLPMDQIVPQYWITTNHSLRFYNDPGNEEIYRNRLIDFYDKSPTLKKMFRLDDPKLAFGCIPMGKLATVDGKEFSQESVLSVIRSTNKILDWNIE